MRRAPGQAWTRVVGATRYEFAIAVIIVAILGGILLQRVVYYQEQAELVAVEQVATALRLALRLRMDELHARPRAGEAPRLADENPMNWLSSKPKNYLGEYYAPISGQLEQGNWYYDKADKTLVYLLNKGKSFGEGRPNLLKFKVKLLSLPSQTAKLSAPLDPNEGLVLLQVNG